MKRELNIPGIGIASIIGILLVFCLVFSAKEQRIAEKLYSQLGVEVPENY